MHRPVRALLLLAASGGVSGACGTVEDEGAPCEVAGDDSCGRPLDLEYMTAAIFAPSCGQTQCHSTFHKAAGLAFDTPEVARASLLLPTDRALLQFHGEKYDPRPVDGARPFLIRWLTEIDPLDANVGRMPFDAPLPNRDIALLEIWIRAPYTLSDGTRRAGGTARGAQCNPALFGGQACNFNDKVTCDADGNFGEVIESCSVCLLNYTTQTIGCTAP